MRVATTERGDLRLDAKYRGELETETAELASETSGRLQRIDVDIGDQVEKGSLIARVDAARTAQEVAEARAEVGAQEGTEQRIQAELGVAKSELSRGERLLADQLITEQEVQALRARVAVKEAELQTVRAQIARAKARVGALGEVLGSASIVAPFNGLIAERYLDVGSLVQPGTRIVRMVREGPLRVRFRVPERDLARLRMGLRLGVTTQATGDTVFDAKVTRIAPEVSRLDRSLAVEAELSGVSDQLRPGMYAEARLELGALSNVLRVPSQAVLQELKPSGEMRDVVYTVVEGRAQRRAVTILGSSAGKTAVEGIRQGAQVVVLGHDALRDGGAVRIVQTTP